jgi:hypothetical protein
MVGEGRGDDQIRLKVEDLLHIYLYNGPHPLLGLGRSGSLAIGGDADEAILHPQVKELLSDIGDQGDDPPGD